MDKTDVDQFLAGYGVVIHQDNADDDLEHFGVKGMHWGDRKTGDHENGAGGSIKETARKEVQKHVGVATVGAAIGTSIAVGRLTGKPGTAVLAGAGAALLAHHALTKPHELDQHVDHGKTFVSNHPAVKKK